jgi:NhaP-type Na+/H+ and K+/H+ antiporter
MPEKDPTTYSLLTYAWVMVLSSWGGFVSYTRKVRTGIVSRYSMVEFIGEISTSAFTGMITFYLCEASNISPLLTAAMVGISGHMGSRAIFCFEQWLQKKAAKVVE